MSRCLPGTVTLLLGWLRMSARVRAHSNMHTYTHASHTRVCMHVLGLYDLTQLLSDTNRACRILYVTLPAIIVLGSCDYLRAQIPVVFYGTGL